MNFQGYGNLTEFFQSLSSRSYMYSTEIDVGYFAAGIAAHLASDDQLDWSKILISKSQLVEELGNVVTSCCDLVS